MIHTYKYVWNALGELGCRGRLQFDLRIWFQIMASCVGSSLNALIMLVFLFFPKLYIIFFVPEKNKRKKFIFNQKKFCYTTQEELLHKFQEGYVF